MRITGLCKLKYRNFHNTCWFLFIQGQLLDALNGLCGKELFARFKTYARWNMLDNDQFSVHLNPVGHVFRGQKFLLDKV